METALTVKVTPPQSTWESAIPMIEAIKRDAKRKQLADKLNIEVGDVFKAGKQISAGNVNIHGNNNHTAPVIQITEGLK